jgi:HK97 gp10 family phage protein
LLANLDDLPKKIEIKLSRGALRAAAKPMQDQAKALAPIGAPREVTNPAGQRQSVGGGELKKSIRISGTFSAKTGVISVKVKAGSKIAWYANIVEHGARPHVIPGPVYFNGRYYKNIQHPGFAARPFMRPAFDATGQAMIDAFADYMRKNLPKALEKNGSL